jgi:hypothetical protein
MRGNLETIRGLAEGILDELAEIEVLLNGAIRNDQRADLSCGVYSGRQQCAQKFDTVGETIAEKMGRQEVPNFIGAVETRDGQTI